MFIQTEATPNPATVKFLPGQSVLDRGTAEFKTTGEASEAPLVQRLFGLQGVEGVFLGADFISVSKDEDTDWSVLKPMVLGALMEHFSTGQPVVLEAYYQGKGLSEDKGKDDEISAQIRELIETRVRPMVAMDGGDIVFDRFEDGVVFLHMRGACSGCPSSTATLKMGIENMLKHFVPEVVEVRPAENF
ncbi:MAG TPA: NifU family protein [Alphaproteobacteria bacterium]|nr:NifU family protein [Alphaproteobacteria bacterium]USO05999.1 MAG: NifU family protein [Rhodospirillales bacterium]HOO82621.1 NifU family protein [Alphaproteobacteria bacterium]